MTPGGYRILDEPRPGALNHLVVDPMWPLFGFMFGGAWLGWLWFLFNGHAVGSPTRWKEVALVIAGIVGAVVIALLFGAAIGSGIVPRNMLWTALLAVTLWKLGITYFLFALQQRSFELYRYFGGVVRSGLLVVVAGYLLRPLVAGWVGQNLWGLVVF